MTHTREDQVQGSTTPDYPPISGGPRVNAQQAASDALHGFLRNLGAVQEANHLLDDAGVSQDEPDHHAPL